MSKVCKIFQIFSKGFCNVLIFHFCLYLIFFPLFSVEVFAGSIYSIQDSARKIYSWIEGEGYRGNTTYIDPIDGRTYTAEGNIKEGAIELATAAAISGAFKIGGKVVGKTGKSVKDTVNSIDDILKKNSQFITYPDGTSVRTATKKDIFNAVEKVKGSLTIHHQ